MLSGARYQPYSSFISTLYKVGKSICKNTKIFTTVDYQERNGSYVIKPVHFFSADHEFIHGNRLAKKTSVSKLLALAIDLFLDEIMENGINPIEIAHLRVIENSYKKKSYSMPHFSLEISKNDRFEKYAIEITTNKT